MPTGVYKHKSGYKTGKPAWNRGLTKEIDHSVLLRSLEQSKAKKGILKNKRITRVCECGCGGEFMVPVTEGRRGKHRYILGHNRRGTTFSLTKEQIRKAVLANTGRKHSEETKEKLRIINTGKKLSEETKLKISMSERGKNHWNYIDGRKSEYDYPSEFNTLLKRQIKTRDNYTCKHCCTTEKLAIHHIDYNKGNCHQTNLITVCRRCNTLANANRDYWFAFYTYKIYEIYEKLECDQPKKV